GDPKMDVAAAKDSARNYQQFIPNAFGHEVTASSPRHARKHVERAARFHQVIPILEPLVHTITFSAILIHIFGNIAIPGGNARMLDHTWSAYKAELLELGHFLDDTMRAVCISQAPAGHAVGLAESIENQDLFIELRRAVKRLVITKDAVDF